LPLQHWETQPLLTRATSAAAEPLFRSEDLPRLLRYWPMKVNAEHGYGCPASARLPSSPPPLSALRVSLLRGVVRRQVIFIRPDTFVHDERYTHGSAVSPSTVNDALRHGNTLLVHNLEIYWKPIGACRAIACAGRLPNVSCRRSPHARAGVFSEALSSFMNLYAQVNLYYSPPGFPGTVSLHQDAQVGGCSCACPAC
jgi:hypothetical protein